jgi:hypothetical protein
MHVSGILTGRPIVVNNPPPQRIWPEKIKNPLRASAGGWIASIAENENLLELQSHQKHRLA